MLKKIHLWIGIIGIIAFILSGQYFQNFLGGLQEMENTPRLLLRTSHIYLFLTSIINLVFGLHYVQPAKIKWFTIYNQSLIMLSPFLVGYGFIFETLSNTGIDRAVSSIGLFLVFGWLGKIVIGKVYGFLNLTRRLRRSLRLHWTPQAAPLRAALSIKNIQSEII